MTSEEREGYNRIDRQTETRINALIEHDLQGDARIEAPISVIERYFSNGGKEAQ